jgi:hypothetical protein
VARRQGTAESSPVLLQEEGAGLGTPESDGLGAAGLAAPLSVPVGQSVSPEALAAAVAALHTRGAYGWSVVMDVRAATGGAPCWLVGVRHATGRRERRLFQRVVEEGRPAWRRQE